MILTTQPGEPAPQLLRRLSSKRNESDSHWWLSCCESHGVCQLLVSFLPTHRGIHKYPDCQDGRVQVAQLTGTVQRKRLSCPLFEFTNNSNFTELLLCINIHGRRRFVTAKGKGISCFVDGAHLFPYEYLAPHFLHGSQQMYSAS